MCTPLVTCAIGTSSTARSGHRPCHMPRATSPWRALTPLAIREERSANCVTPNGSPSSAGLVRPRRTSSPASTPISAAIGAEALGDLVGRVGVVAGGHGRVGREDGAAADGLERVVGRAALGLARVRASSSVANAAWPSLRCTTPGSTPSACSARTPPMPSSRYWLRRTSPSPTYRREVIQRSATSFSGRSASSSSSGTRPTSTRQICATRSRSPERDGDRDGLAVLAGDERAGHAVGVRVDPVLVLPAGGVDALAEVAVAVHQADGDERQRPVGGLLEDVAGEHAEAARVDGQRPVDGVLRAEERRGGVVGDRRLLERLLGERGRRAAPPASARRSMNRGVGRDAASRSGWVSWSRRTGLAAHASQRLGSTEAKSSGPPGVHDQR